jgi:hypothetical protein
VGEGVFVLFHVKHGFGFIVIVKKDKEYKSLPCTLYEPLDMDRICRGQAISNIARRRTGLAD